MENKKQDLPSRPDWLPDHILPVSMDRIDVADIDQAAEALLATMTKEKIHETEIARNSRKSRHTKTCRACLLGSRIHSTDNREVKTLFMDDLMSGNDRDWSNPCENNVIYHADKKQFFHLDTQHWSDNKDGSNIDPESSQHSEPRQDASWQGPFEKPPNFDENVKWNFHTNCWCYEDGMIYYPSAKKFQNPLNGVLSDNQDGSNNQYSHHEHPC